MKIAIDLGGTNVRVARVQDGQILRLLSEPCRARGTESEVLEHICSMITTLMGDDIEGIGIGVPSVVDTRRGIVYNVAGIPSWQEVHLKEVLEARFGVRVNVNNDCNCFALGVTTYGPGKGYRDAACIALGSGVGCGLILDGALYEGVNAGAGEIGSVPYLDSDYEHYCASRWFVAEGTTGKEASQKAAMGDPDALALWRRFGEHLGNLMMMVMYVYDPKAVVLGGSIAHAYPYFEHSMRERMENFPYPETVQGIKVITADSDDYGIIGASLLV